MLVYSAQTDVGRHRQLNEDSVLAKDRLFLVCDGMGGHKAGEVASRLAVETIERFIELSADDTEITWPYGFYPGSSLDGNRLLTSIKLANRAIVREAAQSEEYTGMGTTVAIVLLSQTRAEVTYANVGDSRIYLIRDAVILQISRDDSWANLAEAIGKPATASAAEMKHVLTKALGARDDVDFEVKTQELHDQDVLLLCSDGLTNMLSDDDILAIIRGSGSGGDVDAACKALIDAANAAGGRDNISAVLVRYTD